MSMHRFCVYFSSGKTEIFEATDVVWRDGAVVLTDAGNDIVAFFPGERVEYVKRFGDVIDRAAVRTPPGVTMPKPAGDPPSYTLTQAAPLVGVTPDTLRARVKDGVLYPNAWKNQNSGNKGAAPWMIPLTDLGIEYEAPLDDAQVQG